MQPQLEHLTLFYREPEDCIITSKLLDCHVVITRRSDRLKVSTTFLFYKPAILFTNEVQMRANDLSSCNSCNYRTIYLEVQTSSISVRCYERMLCKIVQKEK